MTPARFAPADSHVRGTRDLRLGDHLTLVRERPGGAAPSLPPLVLVHALGLDLRMWDAVVALLPPGRRVLSYDLRGHGAAAGAPLADGLAAYGADLLALLDAGEIASAHLAGLSFGGAIAQRLALDHPQRVSALDLIATTARAQPSFAERARSARTDGPAASEAETLARWFTARSLADGGAPVAYARAMIRDGDAEHWAAAWRALAAIDTWERLDALACPVRCIAGGADRSTPPALLREISDRVPGASFVSIDDAPHMIALECPKQLARVLATPAHSD